MRRTRYQVLPEAFCLLSFAFAAIGDADELENKLRTFEKRDTFSGAVLLAKGDEVIFSLAVGEASRRYGVNNSLDTKFNIASMGKMFTAVAIMQLVQDGKVQLDDTLDMYADKSWLNPEISSKITVSHLLSHSSGLGDIFVDEFWDASRMKYRELSDYKPLLSSADPEFQPGQKRSYSNAGFLMLGVVIEEVSGKSYDDYIWENVFKPAAMSNTGCYEIDKPIPNLAMGYYRKEGENDWSENTLLHLVKGTPAGGGYSTVEDMFRFSKAIRGYKLLDRKHTQMLLDPARRLGFEHEPTPIGQVVGHSGGFPGIMCKFELHLNKDVTAIILSNMDNAGIPVLRALHSKIRTLK